MRSIHNIAHHLAIRATAAVGSRGPACPERVPPICTTAGFARHLPVVFMIAAGCGSAPSGGAADGTASKSSDGAVASCTTPVRVVAMQDKSDSGNENRTPQASVADLEPLIAQVIRCGGEIALGTIDEQSNAPLARLYVPEPSPRLDKPHFQGTPFEVARARRAYEVAVARSDSGTAERDVEARRRAESFRNQVENLLSSPNHAQRTDVWGGISRAAYFLGEAGEWQHPPELVAVVISDAIDNAGAPEVPLPEHTELLLVNGTPSLGALAALRPRRFESIEAAVRHITRGN